MKLKDCNTNIFGRLDERKKVWEEIKRLDSLEEKMEAGVVEGCNEERRRRSLGELILSKGVRFT